MQVLGNGKTGALNLGAVIILPSGFRLVPQDRLPQDVKERVGGLYFQPYRAEQENIIVVGPVPGKKYPTINFPILAPDPNTTKGVYFLKYPVYIGGNRGRGQVYPDGSKSNNTVFNASRSGTVEQILPGDKSGSVKVILVDKDGRSTTELVPPGPKLLVKLGQSVTAGDALTNNPNVGGFGQVDGEIVL
jgi:apocytochrome f